MRYQNCLLRYGTPSLVCSEIALNCNFCATHACYRLGFLPLSSIAAVCCVNSEWSFYCWDRLRDCNLVNLRMNPKWWQLMRKDYISRTQARFAPSQPQPENQDKEKEKESSNEMKHNILDNTPPIWMSVFRFPSLFNS